MNVLFDTSFDKSVRKLKNPVLQRRVWDTVLTLEQAATLSDIPNVKKMEGSKTFYRVRVGDYRLGFELIAPDTLNLILVAHRKEIYRYFP